MVVRSAPGAPATSHAGARAETETRWEDASTSALTTDPWAQIDYIRSLLRDVYKDAGDGRTVVRELVQNADDAYASRLAFAILDADGLMPRTRFCAGRPWSWSTMAHFVKRTRTPSGAPSEDRSAQISTRLAALVSASRAPSTCPSRSCTSAPRTVQAGEAF